MSVAAVACRDRTGQPYEITLELARNSRPFAAVGERCGYQLAQLAERVRAALRDPELAALWPDPADRFPGPARLHDYRPGESEYFTLRSRDRSDLTGSGELRCTVRSSADWIGECAGVGGRQAPRQRAWPGVRATLGQHHLPGQPGSAGAAPVPIGMPGEPGGPGEPGRFRRDAAAPSGCWRLTRRAVLEAWGAEGIGVRAVLTSAELVTFLDTVLRQPDGSVLARSAPVGGETASGKQGENASSLWRQRGRVPDGSTRSRLPTLRAKARGVAVAERDSPARRGDVRR
ncbi:MAG TPA: hypothetical protein VIJ82_22855 [Streptosporangiaceae bacterium]